MNARLLVVGAALAALVSVSAATAQVSITGVVRTLDVPSTCQQGTHGIECNSVRLQSNTIDLDQHVGQNVRMLAFDVGVECPVFEVYDVSEFPPTTLVMCGNPVPGCPIRLRSGPGAISQHWLLASAGPGFLPLGPVKGTLMLAEPFVIVGTAFVGAVEGAAFDFDLPDDVAFTGLTVYMQSVRRDVGPVGPIAFSNPVCFTILGPSPPCFEPNC